jgi:hypothetical protein
MNLTDQDELDLAGLASGIGNPEGDVRARNLLQKNPAAAAFFRQMSTISEALDSEANVPPPLSPVETDVLATTILARVEQAHAHRKFAVRHRWRWAGLAAAVVAGCFTWYSWDRFHSPVIAELLTVELGAHLSLGVNPVTHTQIRAGEPVVFGDLSGVAKLASGGRIVVPPDTRFTILAGDEIEYQKGVLFVEGVKAIRYRTSGAIVRPEGAGTKLSIQTMSDQPMCCVHEGRVKLIRPGGETTISAGSFALWDNSGGDVQTGPIRPGTPGWVNMIMEATSRE